MSDRKMIILLVGSGAREHALAWKLAQSRHVRRIYAAPGNGGTASIPICANVPIAVDDLEGQRHFAVDRDIEMTVVGPEVPLVEGIVDLFEDENLTIFGPSKAAAKLEGSKAFAKEFMGRHGIPTGWARAYTDFEEAADFVQGLSDLPVLKASGLAAGKGVLLPSSKDEAIEQLRTIMVDRLFGDAGSTALVEERLHGPELSVLAFCDGKDFSIVPAAQDHKRLLEGDRGPNTGGMGAFAPSPLATDALLETVEREIILPTMAGMAAEGNPYKGILYAGLMLTERGPKVLEFNCRFGDPEAQVILPLLQTDLAELILACSQGQLAGQDPVWADMCAVTVVMASGGYPDSYDVGKVITGLPQGAVGESDALVFHAGTRLESPDIPGNAKSGPAVLSDGGRVLSVTATGCSFRTAVDESYQLVDQIQFENAVWRTDIGQDIVTL